MLFRIETSPQHHRSSTGPTGAWAMSFVISWPIIDILSLANFIISPHQYLSAAQTLVTNCACPQRRQPSQWECSCTQQIWKTRWQKCKKKNNNNTLKRALLFYLPGTAKMQKLHWCFAGQSFMFKPDYEAGFNIPGLHSWMQEGLHTSAKTAWMFFSLSHFEE